jgi:hypothetical protein
MKTRNSLVSNSSSSSFVIIGNRVEISTLSEKHIASDNKAALMTYIIGQQLGEGDDVFPLLEKEQFQFVKDNPEFFKVAIIGRMYTEESDDEVYPHPQKFWSANDLILKVGKCDLNSSYCIETLLNNYRERIEKKLTDLAWNDTITKYKGNKNENKKRTSK